MYRKEYDKEIAKLQVELVKLQEWVKYTGAKICVLFEGRDAAGKGGIIKRITETGQPARLPRRSPCRRRRPRKVTDVSSSAICRYLPAAGEIVLFDRSWYNRAGVERVMGFATDEQVKRFFKFAPAVERVISAPASS